MTNKTSNLADTVYFNSEFSDADSQYDKNVRIAKLYYMDNAVCSVNNSLCSFIFVLYFSCNSRKIKLIQGG